MVKLCKSILLLLPLPLPLLPDCDNFSINCSKTKVKFDDESVVIRNIPSLDLNLSIIDDICG